jgi:hypothetical protein
MKTILLLVVSNVFMTFAWYAHLKYTEIPLWKAVLASWGIAFFEYMLMVPANRMGFFSGQFSAAQLKITQEAVTLFVFALFSVLYLKEKWTWNYLAAFVCILLAVYFIFRGR